MAILCYTAGMTLSSAIITLILIMDPFGNIPIFLSVLKHFEPRERRKIILRESLFAFVILLFFLFFGQYVLQGLHLSRPALSMSGGIILFLIAIKMIFPGDGGLEDTSGESFGTKPKPGEKPEDPLLVPLAVPMQAGPSALAFIILTSSQYPEQKGELLLALLIASSVATTVLLLSDALRRILGTQALKAIERLMGMILTTMAIQMLLSGMADYLGGL